MQEEGGKHYSSIRERKPLTLQNTGSNFNLYFKLYLLYF